MSDKKKYPRGNFSNTMLSSTDLERLIDTNYADLIVENIAGCEYFTLDAVDKINFLSYEFIVPVKFFYRLDNGYVYYFQYYGDTKGQDYAEFLNLLNGVKYPAVYWNIIFRELLLLLSIVIVIIAPIIIYRFAIKKNAVEKRAVKITSIFGGTATALVIALKIIMGFSW